MNRLPRSKRLDFEAFLHAESRVASAAVRPRPRSLPSSGLLLLQVISGPLSLVPQVQTLMAFPAPVFDDVAAAAGLDIPPPARSQPRIWPSRLRDRRPARALEPSRILLLEPRERRTIRALEAPSSEEPVTPRAPCNRPHHDSVKLKAPKTEQSLRYLDSRASAPRVPKDPDTSAPKLQHPRPRRASRVSSLKPRHPAPRRAPNTSSPRTQLPTPPRTSSTSTPKSLRTETLRRASGTSNSVNLWRIALGRPDSARPETARANAPKSIHSARSRNHRRQDASSPLHRQLGEPQRIRIPKNVWHVARNEDPQSHDRRRKRTRTSRGAAPKNADTFHPGLEHLEPELVEIGRAHV